MKHYIQERDINSLHFWLIPGDLLSAQFHKLHVLLDSRSALSNPYRNVCLPGKETVCTSLMMVFGMAWSGREPATYHMRGGQPNAVVNFCGKMR